MVRRSVAARPAVHVERRRVFRAILLVDVRASVEVRRAGNELVHVLDAIRTFGPLIAQCIEETDLTDQLPDQLAHTDVRGERMLGLPKER